MMSYPKINKKDCRSTKFSVGRMLLDNIFIFVLFLAVSFRPIIQPLRLSLYYVEIHVIKLLASRRGDIDFWSDL